MRPGDATRTARLGPPLSGKGSGAQGTRLNEGNPKNARSRMSLGGHKNHPEERDLIHGSSEGTKTSAAKRRGRRLHRLTTIPSSSLAVQANRLRRGPTDRQA